MEFSMDDAASGTEFDRVIDVIVSNACENLDVQMASAAQGLAAEERSVVVVAAQHALLANARRKLNRVLLLELHAAQLSGQLRQSDERERFREFVERASTREFVGHLSNRYPALQPRLDRALRQQASALALMVQRLVADRAQLHTLIGESPGLLCALHLGQGDVHNGGQAVARLEFEGGSVMYKPRSVAIDLALEGFLEHVLGSDPLRIRVPGSLMQAGYGWSAFEVHRYCSDDEELSTFYRNIGHWLAAMRLLGGTDLHHENIIAVGPVPVAVDVESLFAPEVAVPSTGLGAAVDVATALITTSVLRTGLVPFRAPMLGLYGVDISGRAPSRMSSQKFGCH
ncbi:hypothetical protein BEN78_11400 [Xanthomonas citri pv. mangiferaeindicae]|nr:hypothetical protein BEN78_11400 [Xanthomonas citri pv. mangiferaeindicae]